MGVSTHAMLCFGVEIAPEQARALHAHIASLVAQAGDSIDQGERQAAVERALGWERPRMHNHDGSEHRAWLADGSGAASYLVGHDASPTTLSNYTAPGGHERSEREAESMRETWRATFGPALSAVGVEAEPAWHPFAWAG